MQSGTGVYYQALPAVGPDGKNVMKLIPVRKVNGQFFHTQLLPSKNVGLPPYESPVPLPQNRVPTLQPTADGRFILKTPLKVNTVFNSLKIKPRESNEKSTTNRSPASTVTLNIIQNTFPSPGKSDNKAIKKQNSPPPPNAVKEPTSQSGHFLTIPSNATVRTLPAPDLPSSIKNKICQTANDSNPSKGMQMVLYVSPVSSVKLDQQAPCPTNPSEVSQTSSPTCTASVVKSPAKPPEGGQGSSTPMKWVIEEREEGSAPILIPVTSTNMCSDILKAVEQMESARFPNQCAKEPVSTDVRKEAVTPVDDDALVMCNGEVYLVAKKDSQVTKNMMSNAESKLQPRKSGQSLTALGPANTSKKQDPKAQADNKSPSDVIDLCDDEEENSNCTSSVGIIGPCDTDSDNDEDSNVIFVSYIPPKSSESETNMEVAQMKSLTGCVKDTESANLDTESMKTNGDINNGTDAEVEACEYEAVRVNTAALESGEASEKTDVVCGQQTHVAEKSFEETVPDPKHQPKSDSELRRAFGIAFDLSVSLQKIDVSDESQAVQPTSERRLINKRTLNSSRELIHHSNIETKIKPPIQAQLTKPVKNGKRKRLDNKEENDFNTFVPNSDYEIESATAEQSRAGQVLQTCQAGQGNKSSTSGAGDTDLLCYSSLVEPPQAQSSGPDCLGLRKTPPRSSKGCGRVCTACPCGTKVGGVAGNSASNLREKPNPSSRVNSSKSVQNKSNRKAAPATTCGSLSENQTTGSSRSHVSRNVPDAFTTADVLTSQSAATVTYSGCTQDQTSINGILQTDAQKPDIPNREKNVSSSAHQFSYTSDGISNELYSELLDPEEIKRQERIKRLKDLLQEKEAALEKLRRSM